MSFTRFIIAFLSTYLIWCFCSCSYAPDTHGERHTEVALRMIGHQVLLHSGDSTSVVSPIERENNQYRIRFEADFGFQPEELVATVEQFVEETDLGNGYILEVQKCETAQVVYAFEADGLGQSAIIPCQQRALPKACYSLLITLPERQGTHQASLIALALIGLFTAGYFMLQQREKELPPDPNLVSIGQYQFDKRSAMLSLGEQKTELSGKETDLLLLLYQAANTTIEREVILHKVWGDEGNYVGRTLDVYVSKLRKKLKADPEVQIVNTRGVGYKLIFSH